MLHAPINQSQAQPAHAAPVPHADSPLGLKLGTTPRSAPGVVATQNASTGPVGGLPALGQSGLTNAQSTYGNQAVLRSLNHSHESPVLQRKCACDGSGGECASCDETKKGTLQRRTANQSEVNGVPPIVHEVLRSPGQPLDAGTRAFMEPRFGYDFSGVKIHTDARAAESARALNALAYTSGKEVVFGAGRYSPGTGDGKKILAHELTHVVQQSSFTRSISGEVTLGRPGDSYERQADEQAQRVFDDGSLTQQHATESAVTQVSRSLGHRTNHLATANLIQRYPFPVASPGGQNPAPDTNAGPDPGLAEEKEQAASIYNKVVNGWTFLAQKQVLAIDSIYTEAKKPSEPSLLEDLLITLCEAALAGALGGIGGLLVIAIEKKITEIFVSRALKAAADSAARRFRDASGKFITTEAGKKLAADSSKTTAKFVSEFAKDSMKESVKSLAKPKIKALLSAGKEAVDGFFEGQKNTAVDAGKKGSDSAEDKRGTVLSNPNPVQTAQAMYEAMNETYDGAELKQKEETLKNWLIYQARLDAEVVGEGVTGAGTTNLGGETWPGFFGSYVPGALYVSVNRAFDIKKAWLKGSTAHIVALLEDKTIKQMGIPVVIELDFPGIENFYINVNEEGFLWLAPRDGGAGKTILRMAGGAREVQGYDSIRGSYSEWVGGDPIQGGFNIWNNRIGPQKVKGILTADK